MDFAFVTALIIVVVFVAVRFNRLTRKRNEKHLLDEIEKDFIDDFSLNKNELSTSREEDLKELIEWVEDVQLEDEIKSKRSG